MKLWFLVCCLLLERQWWLELWPVRTQALSILAEWIQLSSELLYSNGLRNQSSAGTTKSMHLSVCVCECPPHSPAGCSPRLRVNGSYRRCVCSQNVSSFYWYNKATLPKYESVKNRNSCFKSFFYTLPVNYFMQNYILEVSNITSLINKNK